jgi:hypothetical protein
MTYANDLPDFIRSHFKTVWALEILLLLRREPRRAWSPADIVGELRAATALVASTLVGLESASLAQQDEDARYRYSPASTALDEVCDAVEAAYRERPVSLINLISAPEDRLQQLADAFRIRGKGS